MYGEIISGICPRLNLITIRAMLSSILKGTQEPEELIKPEELIALALFAGELKLSSVFIAVQSGTQKMALLIERAYILKCPVKNTQST